MHFLIRVVGTLAVLACVVSVAGVARAQTTEVRSDTDGRATSDGASAEASFKRRVELVEFNTRRISTLRQDAAESATGSPAAGGAGASASGASALPGCYNHIVSTAEGQVTYGHICPGYGGYQGGATAELFGTGEIVLRDPVTGAVTARIPADELTTGATTATVTSAQLAEFALADLALPAPAIQTNPEGDHLVQLPSWLWVDPAQWIALQRTAAAGPVSATVTAQPMRVKWDMGDGAVVMCDGPGTAYQQRFAEEPDATDCKHTFRHSSAGQPGAAYPVTATISWDVSWSGSDGDGGDFGGLSSSATEDVRVQEAQALVQ